MRTEFVNHPPAFDVAPAIAGMAVIRFYEDVQTIQGEDGVRYIAECYETVTKSTANLYARIEKNLDAWIAKAKADTQKRAEEALRAQSESAVPVRVTELEQAMTALEEGIASV